jgi:hypothetical protein
VQALKLEREIIMLLTLIGTVLASNPWGTVSPPAGMVADPGAIGRLIVSIIRLLITAAGIYAIINFILAGYGFMGAGGDPKRVADAWAKIWQTILGLIVVVGAVVIGSIVSSVLLGSPTAIFEITIYGP